MKTPKQEFIERFPKFAKKRRIELLESKMTRPVTPYFPPVDDETDKEIEIDLSDKE